MPKVWLESDMKPIKERICQLQRKLLKSRLQEAAVKAGSHDPGAVALRCLEQFEDEIDWEGDVESISSLRLNEAIREVHAKAPHLWPEGGEPRGSASGEVPKAPAVKSKEDFGSVGEEAKFILEHGRETYFALPGQSKFAKVA